MKEAEFGGRPPAACVIPAALSQKNPYLRNSRFYQRVRIRTGDHAPGGDHFASRVVPLSGSRLMAGTLPDDTEHHFPSRTVSITVLSVKPVKFGRIFVLTSVAVDIDG
jgi:hypothetical protein